MDVPVLGPNFDVPILSAGVSPVVVVRSFGGRCCHCISWLPPLAAAPEEVLNSVKLARRDRQLGKIWLSCVGGKREMGNKRGGEMVFGLEFKFELQNNEFFSARLPAELMEQKL
ncbi:hypothetical protein CRG98_019565 [Punica granatum]|uniref:Uncharacterized protein n=1 Tax=Punica granatum TaxID=22663 RepID=A0A2I0JW25_PUNGR|nr:hypothetical protein CRG98_019565 [Punica granatum]